jgi:signal transduction histidine kinase
MLRHDLFDVDRALGAAVTWALVATGLGVVFAVVIAIGGAVVGGDSPVVAAIATAVCAVLLLPGYRWVHRRVGARLYPMRRAALGAVEALELGVATGQAAPEGLAAALSTALRDSGVAVGFILPGTNEPVDLEGFVVSDARGVPILAAGEPIGTLVIPSASNSLTREVAAASVMLVNVVRLRLHASQSLREVEASRTRIVAAEDAARRRFERDLHDGAQQRLVSLGMSLRLAQRRIAGGGSVDIADLLDGAVAELGTAIAELRRLAHGIRPSVLDDGLAAAVESLARIVPLPVELSIDDTDAGISESVMTTAYYVIAESLANAVKHADADAISVRVDRGVDLMRVTVRDDGRGGADAAGAGIAGLGDRVAAAGGSLRVRSERASGTTIEAELPCG